VWAWTEKTPTSWAVAFESEGALLDWCDAVASLPLLDEILSRVLTYMPPPNHRAYMRQYQAA